MERNLLLNSLQEQPSSMRNMSSPSSLEGAVLEKSIVEFLPSTIRNRIYPDIPNSLESKSKMILLRLRKYPTKSPSLMPYISIKKFLRDFLESMRQEFRVTLISHRRTCFYDYGSLRP